MTDKTITIKLSFAQQQQLAGFYALVDSSEPFTTSIICQAHEDGKLRCRFAGKEITVAMAELFEKEEEEQKEPWD